MVHAMKSMKSMKSIRIRTLIVAVLWGAWVLCTLLALFSGGLAAIYLVALALPWSLATAALQEAVPGMNPVISLWVVAVFASLNCLFLTQQLLHKNA